MQSELCVVRDTIGDMTTITSTDQARAAAYQRVSSGDQSIERQNTANREAASRHGWALTEYADSLSASRFAGSKGGASRADWQRLRADIADGQIDVLVLWESSRGDRQLAGWATLLDTCRRFGVLIYVTNEDYTYDVTKARDWKALAEAGIASAMESEMISVRVKSGKEDGRVAGRPQGSVAWGLVRSWDPSKPKRNWMADEPHPDHAPTVRRIILAAGDGDGWSAIAAALNADGITAPKGGQWWPASVQRIAGNPVYAQFGVVTEGESMKARARLADPARKGERPARMTYRYSGAMRCGSCGDIIRGRLLPSGRTDYYCPANHGGSRWANSGNSVPCAEADAYLDGLAVEFITTRAAELVTSADDSAAARWSTEAAGYRTQMAEAAASFAAGRIDMAQLEVVTATLKPKAEAAEAKAKDAALPGALSGLPDETQAVVAARWNSLTLAARKAALRVIMPAATLQPGRGAPVTERVIPWPENA